MAERWDRQEMDEQKRHGAEDLSEAVTRDGGIVPPQESETPREDLEATHGGEHAHPHPRPEVPSEGGTQGEDIEPPSAGFIVQLFLLPAVIVGIIVLIWVGFGKIATGNRSVEDYMAGLRSNEPKWRWTTAHELAVRLQNDESLAADTALASELKALLEAENRAARSDGEGDDSATFRAFLIRALARMKVPGVLEPVAEAALNDPVHEVRAAAIWALTERAQQPVDRDELVLIEETFAKATEDPTPEVRRFVAYGLGVLGTAGARESLRKLIHDVDQETRFNAAAALARQGDLFAKETLIEMLDPARLRETGLNRQFSDYIAEQALHAIRGAIRSGASLEPDLRQAVRRLADNSDNPALSNAARDILLAAK